MSCTHSNFDRTVKQHREAVLDLLSPLPSQRIPLPAAKGRVLAKDVTAILAVPAFSNSAMDGYLVHAADLHGEGPWDLEVAADIPAGASPTEVPTGKAARIMTGAPTGEHTEDLLVVPVENTDQQPGAAALPQQVRILHATPDRSHIRPRGEDAQPGDVIIAAGTAIDAGTIAALVSCGVHEIEAYALPNVTVFSSGDELVPAGEVPGPGQIPDSNRPMIAELLRNAGANVTQRHVSDDPKECEKAMQEAAAASDLIVTTGGVSAGAFDVIKEVLGSKDMWFGSVAMQPGKPQGAGVFHSGHNSTTVLCLPGNPVSAFVSFYLFVAPALRRLSGMSVARSSDPLKVPATLGAEIRANGPRELFIPARVEMQQRLLATPALAGGVGSHRVASLSAVRGLIHREPHAEAAQPGDTVELWLTQL
ncbi:molybdopterin molybdotransferase MoeA [Corynebacterium gerontici]|uniref:Molybdopterin molybdenumtransferase n=1 Tax=Corynebacterium gerontici TaxID=2079234 RepID=A0A3G6J489_9CORY|nr:gephyrin-like molybdotransferase Glp [Corynebacterium gerontici]AZA11230.1 Molybdopterin molybdenumtransferase [Corynebacterium gerontici]